MTDQEIDSEGDMALTRRMPVSSLLYFISLAIFWMSAVIVIYLVVMAGTKQYNNLMQLFLPVGAAAVLSLGGILAITVRHAGWRVFISTAFLLPLIFSVLGIGVHRNVWRRMDAQDEDIYYTFKEGERLLQGQNLYERILGSDMRSNDKYATYLPLFYQLAHWTQALGLEHFARWMLFWREIFLIFNIAIGALLFYIPYKKGIPILAAFASLFWLFNRWTLSATISADFDFIPMFFLILGLIFFPRRLWLSGLLIGLSLPQAFCDLPGPAFIDRCLAVHQQEADADLSALNNGYSSTGLRPISAVELEGLYSIDPIFRYPGSFFKPGRRFSRCIVRLGGYTCQATHAGIIRVDLCARFRIQTPGLYAIFAGDVGICFL